jgi:microtubule-associated protein, RP/EB family
MMDSAYFVGRMELLDFFNSLLHLQLTKIEQTASGAVACQLTDYIYPGSIPMAKVNWEAKADYEFVSNYKLLQKAFSAHKVQRHVDVDKLIRAKYQDNLEFCQWLKAFYDQSGAVRDDYDARAVRAKGKGGAKYDELMQKSGSKAGSAGRARAPIRPPATTTKPRVPATATQPRPVPASKTATRPVSVNKAPLKASENRRGVAPALEKGKPSVDAQLAKQHDEMKTRIEELENTVTELEKERDFYFGKLRNVELMLQVKQDANFEGCELEGVVGNIFKVLYATAEEAVEVAEDGEVSSINPWRSGNKSRARYSEYVFSHHGCSSFIPRLFKVSRTKVLFSLMTYTIGALSLLTLSCLR